MNDSMKQTFTAKLEYLETMLRAVVDASQTHVSDKKTLHDIQLAAEEVLVNIVNYAYPNQEGRVEISCFPYQNRELVIEISDCGIPFDPLAKAAPDVSLPMEERQVGGLGIFLVKKLMDRVEYRREGQKNILTLRKKI